MIAPNALFRVIAYKRGEEQREVISTANKKLSKRKMQIAENLVGPTELTLKERCQKEGLGIAELCRLFEDDAFTAYVHRLIEGYSEGSLASVWDALIEKCRSGDMRAIKLYFDLKGVTKGAQEGSSVDNGG